MYQLDLDRLDLGKYNDYGHKLTCRKDGQWTFQTRADGGIFKSAIITTRLSTYDELFRLAHVVETLRGKGINELHVRIKSLLGMRSDQADENGSIQLLPITRFINSLEFVTVEVLEPHSLGTIIALKNSSPYYVPWLTQVIPQDAYDIVVSPDAGAYKSNCKREGLTKMHIPVAKYRGDDGTPYTFLPNIENIKGSRCLILDDYIDGGRSSVSLAKDLKELGGASKVILVACHGLFSYGQSALCDGIDEIWTTDSLSNRTEIYTQPEQEVHIIEAP